MQRLMIMVWLMGGLALPGFSGEYSAASPARLANGMSIEGTLQETTVEGMTFQTPQGPVTYPWKYLSNGTRYRFERPFLAKLEADKTHAVKKAVVSASAKAASTNIAVPAVAKVASTNILAPAVVKTAPTHAPVPAVGKDSATNAPAQTPDTLPKKKKQSKNIL